MSPSNHHCQAPFSIFPLEKHHSKLLGSISLVEVPSLDRKPRIHKMRPSEASLDNLPPGIRRCIFEYVRDHYTLYSLVHASPSFHALYHLDRDKIWTDVTLRTLIRRNIKLLVEPVPCVQVSFRDDVVPSANLSRILWINYKRMQEGAPIELNVSECKTLLQITDAILWKTAVLPDGTGREKVLCSRRYFATYVRHPKLEIHYLLNSIYRESAAEADIREKMGLITDKRPKRWAMRLEGETSCLFPRSMKKYETICFGNDFGADIAVRIDARNMGVLSIDLS